MTKPAKIALGIGAAAGSCWLVAGQLGGGPRWVVVWTALACSIASAAYVFNRPAWFGKRAGRLTVRSLSVLPYLAAFRVACEITRRWRAADSASLVAPGVWISGRPYPPRFRRT